MAFIEITSEQRDTMTFRPYAAHRYWRTNTRTGTIEEAPWLVKDGDKLRPSKPGTRLPNGNWLIPSGCIA